MDMQFSFKRLHAAPREPAGDEEHEFGTDAANKTEACAVSFQKPGALNNIPTNTPRALLRYPPQGEERIEAEASDAHGVTQESQHQAAHKAAAPVQTKKHGPVASTTLLGCTEQYCCEDHPGWRAHGTPSRAPGVPGIHAAAAAASTLRRT